MNRPVSPDQRVPKLVTLESGSSHALAPALARLADFPAPQSPKIEEAVLGALLCDSDAIERLNPPLPLSVFGDRRNRLLYQACVAVTERGHRLDGLVVGEELRQAGCFEEAGGAEHLAFLVDNYVTSKNLETHAELLRETHSRRRVQNWAIDILGRVQGGQLNVHDIQTEMESIACELGTPSSTSSNVFLAGEGTFEELLQTVFVVESYLVKQMLYPGGLSLLVGDGGVGKTTLAFQLAYCLASGIPFLGHETVACKVGVLSLETTGANAKARMRQIDDLYGHGVPPNRLFLRVRGYPDRLPGRWDIVDRDLRGELVAWILEHELRVLILDPLAHLHRLNENDTAEMNVVMGAFDDIKDRTGVAMPVIHHCAKGRESRGQQGRGSTVPYDYADVELTLKRTKDGASLTWTKDPRNDLAPSPIRLTKTESGLFVLSTDKTGKPEAGFNDGKDGHTVDIAALTVLRDEGKPMQFKNILAAVQDLCPEATKTTVSRRLGHLERDGLARNAGNGFYEAT